MTKRRCSRCRKKFSIDQFYSNKARQDGLDVYCKSCRNGSNSRWRAANKEKYEQWLKEYWEDHKEKRRAIARKYRRAHPYTEADKRWNRDHKDYYVRKQLERRLKELGFTREQYTALVEAQGGKCAICAKPLGRGEFCLDHSHSTGVVRGILCRRCNLGVGQFSDDPILLRTAAAYLEK